MWVGGAGWAAHFFYDYYLYTGDEEFLAEHALPFMEKVAVFFEDYLYEGPDGQYSSSPPPSRPRTRPATRTPRPPSTPPWTSPLPRNCSRNTDRRLPRSRA
jgi:hypothetical protein